MADDENLLLCDTKDLKAILQFASENAAALESEYGRIAKQSVAAILGVPPYVVGLSGFNQSEWNHFISTTVMPIVRGIEQEMTRMQQGAAPAPQPAPRLRSPRAPSSPAPRSWPCCRTPESATSPWRHDVWREERAARAARPHPRGR